TPSDKDRQHLSNVKKRNEVRQNEQPNDYKGKIVIKPWGYEFLMFENDSVAIWFLHIRKDHSTSMHCHPSKKTSLTLLSGKAFCNTFRHRNFLSASDSLIIDAAVFHSTKALSLDGISLIEVETPPVKLDLCRLEDSYGRENCGYEGYSQMATENLESFNYMYFETNDCHGKKFTVEGKYSISMDAYPSNEEFQRSFFLDPGALYCVCKGMLFGIDESKALHVCETERGSYLQQLGRLNIDKEIVLMKFVVFN
ncbi:hypothetical protein KA005_82375, partial [bacterium]|nr:hypothetical protein [bacterium]